jgi:hypothetical protein
MEFSPNFTYMLKSATAEDSVCHTEYRNAILTGLLIPHPVTLHGVPSSAVVLISVTALIKLLSVGKGLLTCLKEINIITHIAFTSKGKKPGGILYLF